MYLGDVSYIPEFAARFLAACRMLDPGFVITVEMHRDAAAYGRNLKIPPPATVSGDFAAPAVGDGHPISEAVKAFRTRMTMVFNIQSAWCHMYTFQVCLGQVDMLVLC